MRRPILAVGALALAVLAGCGAAEPAPEAAPSSEPADYESAVRALRHDATAVRPLAAQGWVRSWVDVAMTVALPERAALEAADATLPSYLGYDHGGSPLSYVRALTILAEAGYTPTAGDRVVDFGSGGHAQLELWAALGAQPLAIEVEERVLENQRLSPSPEASEVVIGRFPGEVDLEPGSVAVWIAKNVLKHGYIHPEPGTDPRMAIDLGVDDAAFVQALATAMEPRGWLLIYNITPPPNGPGMPYRTWADGRCPFARELLEEAGFDVLAFDTDDTPAAQQLAAALRWDDEEPVFGTYTLLRRR